MKKLVNVSILICAFIVCMTCALLGFGSTNAYAQTGDIETHGASVRLVTPEGIRFLSSVSAEYEDYEVGTLIIPKAILGEETLNLNEDSVDAVSLDYVKVAKTQWSNKAVEQLDGFDYDESRFYFNAVLTDIPETDYGTVLAVRAYAVKDGNYVYGDVIERSIAQVAATSLLVDEENEMLIDYVDTALEGKELSINATNSFIGIAEQQTFEIVNGNGYDAIWTVNDASVGSFDEEVNGKFMAETEGSTTLTAQIGSTVLTANVTTGESIVGEKVVDFTADNYATKVTPGNANIAYADNFTYNGEGMIALKATMNWQLNGEIKDLDISKYSTLKFKTYQKNNGGRFVHVRYKDSSGNYQVLSQKQQFNDGIWCEHTFDVSSIYAPTVDIKIYFGTGSSDDNGAINDVFYVSDIYGAGERQVTKLVSMKNTVGSTFVNDGTNASVEYTETYTAFGSGMAKINATNNWQASGKFVGSIDVSEYSKITFKVFRPAGEGGYYLRIKQYDGSAYPLVENSIDPTVARAAGTWYEVTIDVTKLLNSKLKDLYVQFGTSSTSGDGNQGKYILVSDIYGVK